MWAKEGPGAKDRKVVPWPWLGPRQGGRVGVEPTDPHMLSGHPAVSRVWISIASH